MKRPDTLSTKIFLDSGDPQETKEIIDLLGFLDGQTTNPSLIAKSPEAKARLEAGNKFSQNEVISFYKDVVTEISAMIPDGSVSVEVYANNETDATTMYTQGSEMFSWIPNAHIKYPTNTAGLKAAEQSIREGKRVNMTLVFTQQQAAAVYAATRGAAKGDVFLSPFVGRLDDRGEDGMSFIKSVIDLYGKGDDHVEVLTASVRSLDHFMAALALHSDIITSPGKILKEWAEQGMPLPDDSYSYDSGSLTPIAPEEIDLALDWSEYDSSHELTDKGITRFADDWNNLIG